MAGTVGELNIKIAANVAQLSQDVTKVEREMRKMRTAGVKASKDMQSAAKSITSFKDLAVGIGSVIVAYRTLTRVVGSAMDAYATQQNAEKTLEVAIGGTNQALLDQASALQKVTVFGDEAIIGVQAMIGSFIKDEEQIKKATKATLDLAQAKGMDLKAAGDLVSKTLGSSTNAMSRYGIEVNGAVGSTERLESLTQNIQRLFGGQAAAAATTMSGRIQQMKNAFGDLQEVTVKLIAPAITSLAEDLTALAENAQKVIDAFAKFSIETDIGGPLDEHVVGPLGNALEWLTRMSDKADALLNKIIPGREGWVNPQTGAPRLTTDQLIQIQEEEEEKARARKEAAEKAATTTGNREELLQARIDQNKKYIEEEQKLWQAELDLETANKNAEEAIHKRRMARLDEEQAKKRLLINQQMNMTSEVLRAASAAESAGLASFNTTKKVSAAMALVNAYLAISQAWSEPGDNVYTKIAKVAYVAGQVFSVVGALKGVSVSGGGGGAAVPGAPPAAGGQSLLDQNAQNVNIAGGGQTTIVFQGGTFIGGDKDALARELVPAIEQALTDGQR